MKSYPFVLAALLILSSCKKNPDSEQSKSAHTPTEQKSVKRTEKIKETINDFDNILSKDSNSKNNSTEVIDKTVIERLFQFSGIPKNEYQEKLNNPDTLKQLIKYVEKNIKDSRPRRGLTLKGNISLEQLTSRNTQTGVSIEEAILLLQKELKGKISSDKLKKIDSVSGTELISKLPERDARKVLQYVYSQENRQLRPISLKAGYMHNAKEAEAYKNELEALLENYMLPLLEKMLFTEVIVMKMQL